MLEKSVVAVEFWHYRCYKVVVNLLPPPLTLAPPQVFNLARTGNEAYPKMKGKQMKVLMDAIAEVKRERTVRAQIYSRLVAVGKLTQAEADERASRLSWAQAFLQKMLRHWDEVAEWDTIAPTDSEPRME